MNEANAPHTNINIPTEPDTAAASAGQGSHTGKIARLPHAIRQELNERLQDGQAAPEILAWVNELPEVKALLARRFDAQPINKQNLSAWRQGGFKEWELRQQAKDVLLDVLGEDDSLGELTEGRTLADGLALLVASQLLAQYQAMMAEPDAERRWAKLQQTVQMLTQLRREDHRAAKRRAEEGHRQAVRERQARVDAEPKVKRFKRQALRKLDEPWMDEARLALLRSVYRGQPKAEQLAREHLAKEKAYRQQVDRMAETFREQEVFLCLNPEYRLEETDREQSRQVKVSQGRHRKEEGRMKNEE